MWPRHGRARTCMTSCEGRWFIPHAAPEAGRCFPTVWPFCFSPFASLRSKRFPSTFRFSAAWELGEHKHFADGGGGGGWGGWEEASRCLLIALTGVTRGLARQTGPFACLSRGISVFAQYFTTSDAMQRVTHKHCFIEIRVHNNNNKSSNHAYSDRIHRARWGTHADRCVKNWRHSRRMATLNSISNDQSLGRSRASVRSAIFRSECGFSQAGCHSGFGSPADLDPPVHIGPPSADLDPPIKKCKPSWKLGIRQQTFIM